jgi:hypothetical protein
MNPHGGVDDDLGEMPAAQFLQSLGFGEESRVRYLDVFRGADVNTALELEAVPEDTLLQMGVMRGHARRIVTEFQRLRRVDIVPPSTGMERHGSLLDPSPLTTPVSPNRARFPSMASPTALRAPALPATTALPPSPAQGPADKSSGRLEVQHFTCFICMDFIVSPRTIACGHSFCAHCISHWAEVRDDASCPLCRTSMRIAPGERVVLPPLNKMLDEVSRHAFPHRYRVALQRVEAAIKAGMELRKWQLFTRHPSNALLVKITCDALSGGAAIPRRLEIAMLQMPRLEFCPPRIDPHANALSCETGPSRIESLNFNVTAASIQAALLSLLDIRPGNTFLDVGTGSGTIAAWASALTGPTGAVLGIDIGKDACEYARRNIAIQYRKAKAEEPPVAPVRPEHCTTWWVHPGATAIGRAVLMEPIAATQSNARKTGLAGGISGRQAAPRERVDAATMSAMGNEYDQVNLRITSFDAGTGAVEATVVSGKVHQRHAKVVGFLRIQSDKDRSMRAQRANGLKPVRARPNPGDDSGRPLSKTKSDSPVVFKLHESPSSPNSDSEPPRARPAVSRRTGEDAAGTALWRHVQDLPKAALHLEEVLVFGDSPKLAYHYVNKDTIHPAEDPTIAGTRLHYVLRLTIVSAIRSAVSELASLDGFVGFKTAKGKMMKIAEISLTLDDATLARIRSWEATFPPSPTSGRPTPTKDQPDDDDDDDLSLDARSSRSTPPPPPVNLPTTRAALNGVSPSSNTTSNSTPNHGPAAAGTALDEHDKWPVISSCLSRVHIAQLNIYDLVGALMQNTSGTVAAVQKMMGMSPPDTVVETTGLFDRVFVGAEPQSDREFALCLRLLKDNGRMIVPYKNELLLLYRSGDSLVCEPKMNVSFGGLVFSDTMTTSADHVLQELQRCTKPAALATDELPSPLRPAPRGPTKKTFFATCCGAPLMPGNRLASKPEAVLGDRLRVLDDHVHIFSPDPTNGAHSDDDNPVNGKPFESLLSDAFDGTPVYLSGLGCSAVYVKCPCGRPVGMRLVSEASHAPQGESWIGAVLLAQRFTTTMRPSGPSGASHGATTAAAQRNAPDVACSSCRATLGSRSKMVRETMDWFDLPTHASTPTSASPAGGRDLADQLSREGTVANLTRTQMQTAPSSANDVFAAAAVRYVTASLFAELDQERIALSASLFNHITGRSVVPCRYKMVHCAGCRAVIGCHVLEPVHVQDLPQVAPLCGRFVVLLNRVSGLQAQQRLDVLQRVFSAILGQSNVPEMPARRFNPAELMEFFSGGSDEDDDDEDVADAAPGNP